MKNPLKLIGSLIKGIGKGAIQPLPLSGVLNTIKEVKEAKWEFEKVIKLAVYLLIGLGLWAVILGKITIDDLIAFIKALGV